MGSAEILLHGDGVFPRPLQRTWDQWKYYGMEMRHPTWKGHGTSKSIMGWRWGTPQKGHGTSGSIMGWRWATSPPPPRVRTNKQTENITSRRTSVRRAVISNYSISPQLQFRELVNKAEIFLPEFQLMSSLPSFDSLIDKVTNDESVKQFTLDMFRSLNSVHASDNLATVI